MSLSAACENCSDLWSVGRSAGRPPRWFPKLEVLGGLSFRGRFSKQGVPEPGFKLFTVQGEAPVWGSSVLKGPGAGLVVGGRVCGEIVSQPLRGAAAPLGGPSRLCLRHRRPSASSWGFFPEEVVHR